MSILGYAIGLDVLVVGVEDDPTETYDDGTPCLRVYIGARWRNQFCVASRDDVDAVRRAWSSQRHVVIPRPPDGSVYEDHSTPGGGGAA